MSQLKEQYQSETERWWYKDDPVYTEAYVNWLEAKVEKLTAHNKQSTPCRCDCGADLVQSPETGEMICPSLIG
jgi:hypothetical protein